MPELFDMIAGSETGAIIAGSLVVKNTNSKTMATQANANFAEKSIKWFESETDILYHDGHMPMVLQFLITVFIVVLFSYGAFY